MSGTFNAALYALKELDIPAIAVSAANKYGIVRSYQAVQSLDDPAIRFAQDTLAILRALEEASAHRVAMLQQATAPSLQPVPVLASANASAGAGATAGSSSSSTGSTGRISASVTRDSTCVRRVRPLLPPNVGLNINLAYPEDVGDASTERTWLLTRMVEPESRRKVRQLSRHLPCTELASVGLPHPLLTCSTLCHVRLASRWPVALPCPLLSRQARARRSHCPVAAAPTRTYH